MSSEKSTAIVLRVVEFSESSCVVTLMTRDFGKITALAKGARRKKSPFEAALDVLSICRIVFIHKTSQAMDLLTEAKLERRFRSASKDLERLYAGFYVVELLSALTDESDPHPDLFDTAEQTILQLDTVGDIAEVLLRFELTALRQLGHQPTLHQCAGCGRKKTDSTRRVNFGLNAGGVLCDKCRSGKTSILSLSSTVWQQLVALSDEQSPPLGLTKTDKHYGEIRQAMNQYISHLLNYQPRLQKYISTDR